MRCLMRCTSDFIAVEACTPENKKKWKEREMEREREVCERDLRCALSGSDLLHTLTLSFSHTLTVSFSHT